MNLVMKRILCLLLVVTPAVAYADKNFKSGKGATWDCKKDPKVNISHGKGVYTFKGPCTQINLNGGKSKLTIESVDELNVTSAENTITIGTLGTLNLVGAKNKVTYKTAKEGDTAQVSMVGSGNVVEKAGGAATTTTTAGAGAAGATAGAGAAGAVAGTGAADLNALAGIDVNAMTNGAASMGNGGGRAIDCSKNPTFIYNDNNGTFTFTGKCEKISINGNNAKLTIESVKTLAIQGNGTTATVTAVDTIATPGNKNSVTYKKAVTANGKVKVSNPGNGNSVKLVK